jgi:hypothetical protein
MPYVWRCQISYNGSGTFNINTAGQPVVTGTVISSTAFNALTADLGTGLSTAITKDGQTVATARIPFAAGINSSLVTDATSTTTGSIITAGGVGIAKALYVGTTLNVTGASTLAGITGTFNGTVGATTPSTGAFTTLSATGNISTSAGGDVGIGMTPVNVLDITKTQNAASRANLLNSNASGAASAAYRATNGNANMEILMLGTGFTTAGVNTANTGVVSASYDLALSYGGGGAASLKFAYGSTEMMRLNSSGNLGLGVTPSATTGSGVKGFEIGGVGDGLLGNGGASAGNIWVTCNTYFSSGFKKGASGYASIYNQSGGIHTWSVSTTSGGSAGDTITFTDAMTLDSSGRLLVGQTTVSNSINGLYFDPAGGGSANIVHASGTTSGTGYAFFLYAGGSIGSITQNGTTGVLYNLTSDYRLKNDQQPLTGAKDFIMALKPKKWQWWDGSGEGVGFVAHEFMEVAKYSGHGEKDAVEMQTYEISPAVPATQDKEGNEVTAAIEAVMGEREVPKYQSIQPSSSEVMANLVAHIQELESRLAALEAK